MYQALYRKWRPITFSQVVGQEHITDTLRRQVAEGRTGHAYLFTGTRGTGKTTCARILAKAINCLHPVDGAPCNQCEACRGIDEGRLLDITELDAASNNGVDSVRALREEAVYTPSVLKKRVYIIDEVHMLSTPAFNALLKILEEPPEHLVFILATTELHKVPATILSRCQRYSFKRILPRDIARQLRYIAGEEQIDLTPDGADILARMAGGAMRDALSLLDQCRSFEGTLSASAILNLLGLAGGVQTARLMELLLKRDAREALLLLDQLYRDGKDIAALLRELSDLCRDLLILHTAPEGGAALLTGLYEEKTLSALGADASGSRLFYMAEVLGQTLARLSDSGSLRTEAELCLLKLCDESLCGDLSALNTRLERLEKAAARGFAAPVSESTSAPSEPQPEIRQPIPSAPAPKAQPVPAKPEPKIQPAPAEKAPAPSEPKAAASAREDGEIWARLQNQYKAGLRTDKRVFLNRASGVLSGGVLTVTCPDDMVKRYLDCPEVNGVLQSVTEAQCGSSVRVVFTLGSAKSAPLHRSDTESAPPKRTKPAPNGTESAPPVPAEKPAETPPWEAPPPASDRMDELLEEAGRLDNFNIK